MFPSRLVPAIQVREFDAQDSRLYLVHAPVGAHDLMLVADARAVVAHHAHPLSQVRIVGDTDASFTVRSECLAAIQTEAADVADATDGASLIGSAMRL